MIIYYKKAIARIYCIGVVNNLFKSSKYYNDSTSYTSIRLCFDEQVLWSTAEEVIASIIKIHSLDFKNDAINQYLEYKDLDCICMTNYEIIGDNPQIGINAQILEAISLYSNHSLLTKVLSIFDPIINKVVFKNDEC